jgi:hypothetical protein
MAVATSMSPFSEEREIIYLFRRSRCKIISFAGFRKENSMKIIAITYVPTNVPIPAGNRG